MKKKEKFCFTIAVVYPFDSKREGEKGEFSLYLKYEKLKSRGGEVKKLLIMSIFIGALGFVLINLRTNLEMVDYKLGIGQLHKAYL